MQTSRESQCNYVVNFDLNNEHSKNNQTCEIRLQRIKTEMKIPTYNKSNR